MAERALRRAQEAEIATAPPADDARGRTVDDAAVALRERLELQGARKSYRQNCESMLRRGLAPKSVRNVITCLYGVFGLAVDRGWS